MGRAASISISLTPAQLRRVNARVRSGEYRSADELILESLRRCLSEPPEKPSRRSLLKAKVAAAQKNLASAYKATAARDLKLAREWSRLKDPWPHE
jgi:Arc/MetJ-type ribon-helix-helix transcriptional regulator